jgi:hypothetical protein
MRSGLYDFGTLPGMQQDFNSFCWINLWINGMFFALKENLGEAMSQLSLKEYVSNWRVKVTFIYSHMKFRTRLFLSSFRFFFFSFLSKQKSLV